MTIPYSGVLRTIAAEHPLLGLALLHHRTTRGGPLGFASHPYLVEMYRDFPKIDGADGVKAVQTGWSELLVQLALERAGWRGRTVAYVLPTSSMRDRFVHTRVEPLLTTVPAYRDRVPGGTLGLEDGAGSLKVKRFGPKGTLMFLGSNSPIEFVEFSADCVILDEYDLCDGRNAALAKDRLKASPYPQLFRIGNPELVGKGVSLLYSESDGRRWFHRCERCGYRQALEWELHVVRQADDGGWLPRDVERFADPSKGDLRPVCLRCAQPFERVAAGAAWVASHPSRVRRGYTMSRLDVLSQSLRELFAEWVLAQGHTERIAAFYRSNLGRAYEKAGSSVSRSTLERAAVGAPMDPNGGDAYAARTVTAGVDVGSLLNVTVSVAERNGDRVVRRAVWVGAPRTFEEVEQIFLRYRVRCAVVDARPETRKAQELRDRMRARRCSVWLAQFHPTDRVGADDYGMRQDHVSRVVTVDRTQLLDATLDDLQASPPKRVLPRDVLMVDGFVSQMTAPKRVLSERGDRYVWHEGDEPDHYRFADAYDRVAYDLMNRGGTYHVVSGGRPGDDDDPERGSDVRRETS